MSIESSITISAPGKLFFLGEHFVVLGGPALIAGVGLRCTVNLTPRADNKVSIHSRSLHAKEVLTIDQLLQERQKAQSIWNLYNQEDKPQTKVEILKGITIRKLSYAEIAIGEALNYYRTTPSSGFDIDIDSQVPVGAGLGSSAATSVSLIGAIALFLGQELQRETINIIAYEAEKRKHGNPSGADNSTVTYGGIISFLRNPLTIKPLDIAVADNLAGNFVLINTGKPKETTGEMVTKVGSVYNSEGEDGIVHQALKSQTELVKELLRVIQDGNEGEFVRIIQAGEQNLERIGVVSKSSQTLIRAIEKAGGAAKICGAGGITGPTGIVLAFHRDRPAVENIAKAQRLKCFSATLGVAGLRIEPK